MAQAKALSELAPTVEVLQGCQQRNVYGVQPLSMALLHLHHRLHARHLTQALPPALAYTTAEPHPGNDFCIHPMRPIHLCGARARGRFGSWNR